MRNCAISPPASVPLEIGRSAARPGRRRLAIPQIGDISNLDEDNKVRALDDRRRLDSLGNRLWHTDASYMPVPVVLGLLHAVAAAAAQSRSATARPSLPTCALPMTLCRMRRSDAVDPLIAEHDVFWSRARSGSLNSRRVSASNIRRPASAWCAAIRVTGRKSLYLSAHASHIVGWPVADGRLLLLDLNTHATQRNFVYSHTWRMGDLVIWDNRWTMHRGRPHDENQPRDLRRATTLDTGSTLEEGGIA